MSSPCDHKFVDSNVCLKCGWNPDEPAFKVLDKRGQPREERKLTAPDYIADIKATDDPMVFVAVLPGNRVPEQRFKVSRLEATGVKLLSSKATGIGPQGRKAIHAARMKVLKVMENAMRVHLESDGTAVKGPGVVQ